MYTGILLIFQDLLFLLCFVCYNYHIDLINYNADLITWDTYVQFMEASCKVSFIFILS